MVYCFCVVICYVYVVEMILWHGPNVSRVLTRSCRASKLFYFEKFFLRYELYCRCIICKISLDVVVS